MRRKSAAVLLGHRRSGRHSKIFSRIRIFSSKQFSCTRMLSIHLADLLTRLFTSLFTRLFTKLSIWLFTKLLTDLDGLHWSQSCEVPNRPEGTHFELLEVIKSQRTTMRVAYLIHIFLIHRIRPTVFDLQTHFTCEVGSRMGRRPVNKGVRNRKFWNKQRECRRCVCSRCAWGRRAVDVAYKYLVVLKWF